MNTPRKDLIFIISAGVLLTFAVTVACFLDGLTPELTPKWIKPIVLDEQAAVVEIPQLLALPKGIEYPATPRASLLDNIKDWLSPEENEDSWDYDLFTTIDVVWDPATKDYVPSRRKIEPLPPFGVALVNAEHPKYPYVLRSTMPGRSGKEEDREFSIENIATKEYFDRCKLKKPLSATVPITPLSYKSVKEKDDEGFTSTRNVLRLDDKQLGQVVEIDDIKPLEFPNKTDLYLASTSDPADTWVLHAVGDKFTYKGALYVVKGIDLDAKTVTVDKTFTPNPKKGKKTFTEALNVAAPVPVAKPTSTQKTPLQK